MGDAFFGDRVPRRGLDQLLMATGFGFLLKGIEFCGLVRDFQWCMASFWFKLGDWKFCNLHRGRFSNFVPLLGCFSSHSTTNLHYSLTKFI